MRRIIILLLIGCMTVFMIGCSGGGDVAGQPESGLIAEASHDNDSTTASDKNESGDNDSSQNQLFSDSHSRISSGFNYELKEHYNSREEVLEEMEELSNEYWYGSEYPYDDQAFERYMATRKTLEDLLEGEFALSDEERKLESLNDAVNNCVITWPDGPEEDVKEDTDRRNKALQIKAEVEAGERDIDEALEILYYDFCAWDKLSDPWLYDKLFGETGPTRQQDYEGWKKY